LYADTADPEAVVAALRQALDPAAGRDLGARARQRMTAHWDWDHLAVRYRDFFYDLVGSRQGEKSCCRSSS
jgi:hypothetical protein